MTPTYAQDVVAVLNQESSVQVFANARPLKANITETAQVMTHPVEDGTSITDHKIINLIQIQLSMILSSSDYRSVYRQIKDLFVNSTSLIVQTRSDVYRNMIISSMPHDEDADIYDGMSLSLSLTEVRFAKVSTGKLVTSPLDPTDLDTQDGGKKQLNTETGSKKQSLLREILQ